MRDWRYSSTHSSLDIIDTGCHFHASTTFALEKPKQYLLNMGQSGPQNGSGRFGGDKNLVPLLRIEINFSSSASRLFNRLVLFFVLLFLSREAENFIKQKNHTKSTVIPRLTSDPANEFFG